MKNKKFLTDYYTVLGIYDTKLECVAGSAPPSPRESQAIPPVTKQKSETKKKWLKLTRKGLLLTSICKVGKNLYLSK